LTGYLDDAMAEQPRALLLPNLLAFQSHLTSLAILASLRSRFKKNLGHLRTIHTIIKTFPFSGSEPTPLWLHMPKYFPPDHKLKKPEFPKMPENPQFRSYLCAKLTFTQIFLYFNFSRKILYISEKKFFKNFTPEKSWRTRTRTGKKTSESNFPYRKTI